MARASLKNVARLLGDVNTQLPPEQAFLCDLKRSIEMDANSGRRPPSRTYKPSGMNCIRCSYYQLMGVEMDEPSSAYTMVGICNSGTDIHVRIQTAVDNMKNNGMDCEYIDVAEYVQSRQLDDLEIVSKSGMETKLYHKKYNMSFLCDGIIRYKGKYYILELKTEGSFKFMNRNGVDPGHYKQGTAYSLAFGIDRVLFVYISRDMLDMKAFMLDVSDDMRSEIVQYVNECDGYVSRGIVPPKPVGVPKKSCSYCGYRNQCRKDG